MAQLQSTGPAAPAPLLNLEGMGEGFRGPQGPFLVSSMPPVPTGDVGRDHYVQLVIGALSVFDKRTGRVLAGPAPTRSRWPSDSPCAPTETDSLHPGVIRYDRFADRWILVEVTLEAPYFVCVGVSQTDDPTGRYFTYPIPVDQRAELPELALWPDAYYLTVNVLDPAGEFVTKSRVYALDRVQTLAHSGALPKMQSFDLWAPSSGSRPSTTSVAEWGVFRSPAPASSSTARGAG